MTPNPPGETEVVAAEAEEPTTTVSNVEEVDLLLQEEEEIPQLSQEETKKRTLMVNTRSDAEVRESVAEIEVSNQEEEMQHVVAQEAPAEEEVATSKEEMNNPKIASQSSPNKKWTS